MLVETNRKSQSDNLLKTKTFFGLKVSVTEHKSLNTSKGIIRDRMLKGEKEDDIVEYLKEQGVVACKRFTIKKDHETVQTNTLLLTFNSVSVPKALKIFYRIVPVDVYVPNSLRCFNYQRFGHQETNCPVDIGSVCEKCGAGGHDHHTSACKNAPKCVNCGKDHLSRSNQCEVWKKEKEISKIKVTKNVPYLEAKKIFENETPELDFTKIVSSLSAKPESKTIGTQFLKVILPLIHLRKSSVLRLNQSLNQNQHRCLNRTQILSLNQTQGLGPVHHVLILSLVRSLVLSLNLVLNQVLRIVRKRKKKISLLPARVLVGDHILARLHPLKNMAKDLMILLKWPINSMV